MVIEHVLLPVKSGQEKDFEEAFSKAKSIISRMPGFCKLTLAKPDVGAGSYLLLVEWDALEDHTEGFRKSKEYKEWSKLLHHFYDPFPQVSYFSPVISEGQG